MEAGETRINLPRYLWNCIQLTYPLQRKGVIVIMQAFIVFIYWCCLRLTLTVKQFVWYQLYKINFQIIQFSQRNRNLPARSNTNSSTPLGGAAVK